MLTDIEVKRLEEVQKEYQALCKEQGALRNSEILKKKYQKGLSAEERQELRIALEKEEDLEKRKDVLVEERRALTKKRYGNWRPTDNSYSPYYDHRYGIMTDR